MTTFNAPVQKQCFSWGTAQSQRSSRTGLTWDSCETLGLASGSMAKVWWRSVRSRDRSTILRSCTKVQALVPLLRYGAGMPTDVSEPDPSLDTTSWHELPRYHALSRTPCWLVGWSWLWPPCLPCSPCCPLPVRMLLLTPWCNLSSPGAARPCCALLDGPKFFLPCKMIVFQLL